MNFSEELFDQMITDAEEGFKNLSEEDLRDISALANRQMRLEDQLAKITQLQEIVAERLKDVSENLIPNAIESMGLSSFRLSDGSELEVVKDIRCAITKEKKEQALTWLRDTDNDGIIKNEVTLSFGKGQDSSANELTSKLSELGYSYVQDKTVHWQTLKAFIKNRLREGLPTPLDIFSVFETKKAKIKRPKK